MIRLCLIGGWIRGGWRVSLALIIRYYYHVGLCGIGYICALSCVLRLPNIILVCVVLWICVPCLAYCVELCLLQISVLSYYARHVYILLVPTRLRGIGIRIEDDVLISAEGRAEVTTRSAAKEVDEIEALMC